jgi:hypothetical protein
MNKTNTYLIRGACSFRLEGAAIDRLDYFFEEELKEYAVNDFKISNIYGEVYGYIGEEDEIEECEISDFLLTYKDKEVNLNEEELEKTKNGLENIILFKCVLRFDVNNYCEPLVMMLNDYIDEEDDEEILEFINFLKNLKNRLES